MSNRERYLHILLRYDEREAAPRRGLRACDDSDILPGQGAECMLDNFGYVAHGLADHRDQRDRRIVDNMLQFFRSEIMREFAT